MVTSSVRSIIEALLAGELASTMFAEIVFDIIDCKL